MFLFICSIVILSWIYKFSKSQIKTAVYNSSRVTKIQPIAVPKAVYFETVLPVVPIAPKQVLLDLPVVNDDLIPHEVIFRGADRVSCFQHDSDHTVYTYIYNAGYIRHVTKNHQTGLRQVFEYSDLVLN